MVKLGNYLLMVKRVGYIYDCYLSLWKLGDRGGSSKCGKIYRGGVGWGVISEF